VKASTNTFEQKTRINVSVEISIAYSCEHREGVHFFSADGELTAEDLCDEVARRIRNLCVLVGPSDISIGSAGNFLSSQADHLLSSEWLLGIDGSPLFDILSRWRGVPTTIRFVDGNPKTTDQRHLMHLEQRGRAPRLPALVINVRAV